MKNLINLLFISFFILQGIVCQEQFILTKYTKIISILNEAVYYSSNKNYGQTPNERVEEILNQFRNKFQNTLEVLKYIKVLQAEADYCLFIEENSKTIYVVMRGTQYVFDVVNDYFMFRFALIPRNIFMSILMGGQVKRLSKSYKIVVSGHSLGATLALFACSKHRWVHHCEVHNPYYDYKIIFRIDNDLSSQEMKNKVYIQRTKGEFLSYGIQKLLNVNFSDVPFSIFEKPSNVKVGLLHSALTLFAKCFLEDQNQKEFDLKNLFEEEVPIPVNDLKSEIDQSFQCFISCEDGYYVLESNKCEQCPKGHYCIVGAKIPCWPGTYASSLGSVSCKLCEKGYYTSKEKSENCKICPAAQDKVEEKILQNEVVCPCIYYDNNEKNKAIGIKYNIDDSSTQKSAQNLLTLSDERLQEILSGEDNLTVKETRILYEETLKIAQSEAQNLFPSFQNHNKGVQNVLIDLLFNMGKGKVTEFKRFKTYLENKDYEKAALELIYIDSSLEDKKQTHYCQQFNNRCMDNAHILTQCQVLSESSISKLQILSNCISTNKQCISEMVCLKQPSCMGNKNLKENKEKIPCIYSCLNEHKLYQFLFSTPSDQVLPLDLVCLSPYLKMTMELTRTPYLNQKGIIGVSDPLSIIKAAQQDITDQSDPFSPVMLKIINSYQFCSNFEYINLLREFYGGEYLGQTKNQVVNDDLNDKIYQKSKSSECNYVSKDEVCSFDESSSSLTLSLNILIFALLTSLLF